MKLSTILIALVAIQATLAAQGTPAATSLCMGNTDDSTNCSSCYNWGPGTIGARMMVANVCTPALTNKVTDCQVYSGSAGSNKSVTDCSICDGKDWLNLTTNAAPASRVIACSNTALDKTACASTISNCKQSICLKDGSTYKAYCSMCDSGYKPSGTQVTVEGNPMWYTACTSGSLTEAKYYSGMNPLHAYTCSSDFAVANDNLSCKAFTKDSNCRKLGTGNTYCGECWYSYYFDTTTCKLAAGLMAFGGIVMAALTVF